MTQTQGERVKRAALRCGVRVLVVAGFASAAWLLSTSTAEAATSNEPAPAPLDLSVLNLVADLGDEVLGTELLTIDRADKSAPTVALLPCLELACPVPAKDPVEPPADETAGGLTKILRGLAAPLGLDNVVRPLTRALDPVVDLDETVQRTVRISRIKASALPRTAAVPTPAPVIAPPVAAPAELPEADVERAVPTAADGTAASPTFSAALPRAPGGGHVPQLPEPTAPKSPLGTGSGSSTSGSGSHHDGGSFAVVTSSAVTGAVASHRRSRAADVAVQRRDAEDPTFSPD